MIKTNFGECVITLVNDEDPSLQGFVDIKDGYILLYLVDDNNGLIGVNFYPFDSIYEMTQLGRVSGEKVE